MASMDTKMLETEDGLHHRRRSSLIPGRKGSMEKNIEHGAEIESADHLLETLGYAPELLRTRSTFQVAFMSFVLASIPYGLATTFFYPLVGGGPTNIIWGWFMVSIIILCVALSLGEITSVYPTAGGVYYQTFMLSPPSYRRIASWICGWSYVVGNITITLAVNFGTTLFLVACINVFPGADGNGIFQAETYQVFLIFLGITLLCNAVSALGNRWLPILDVCHVSTIIHRGEVRIVLTLIFYRHLPSSGPLLGSWQSSLPFWSSQRTADTPLIMSLLTLSHNRAGQQVGHSALASCKPPTLPLRLG
jgi:hypothetical protein